MAFSIGRLAPDVITPVRPRLKARAVCRPGAAAWRNAWKLMAVIPDIEAKRPFCLGRARPTLVASRLANPWRPRKERTRTMPGITVGIDGSDNAHHALIWAMNEAVQRDVPLTVLTVHPTIDGYWSHQPVTFAGDARRVDEARQAAEDAVAQVTKEMGEEKYPQVSVRAISGFAAQALIDASADADLVVVGTLGGGGFPHLNLGAISNQVVHHAKCPVVVVPHDR
jgi:nucleotide-binding universal stress UspA family protein